MLRLITVILLLSASIGLGSSLELTIDDTTQHQQIEGFGAALTDSSALILNQGLTEVEKDALLTELFSEDSGIGLNYIRYPMGSSDFRMQDYTYNDMPAGQTDPNLTNFSMDFDITNRIPLLQQVAMINTNMKVMGTPWSPPAWMKDSDDLYYGELRSECYHSYAQYFLRFIQTMESNGVPMHSVTLQNEPLFEPHDYPGMYMHPTNQARLATLVGQTFASNSISTRLFIYDHNWDQFTYPVTVLDDALARPYIAGAAFHGYAGDVSMQSLVHDVHPDKDLYFTEITSGEWSSSFESALIWDAQTLLIGALENWSKTIIKWNLVLDQNNGPKIEGGCENCYGLVTVNTDTHQITRNADFYALAHASKFIRSGAVRIHSDETSSEEKSSVAFQNADGSLVVIVCNAGTSTRNTAIRWNGESISYPQPARSVATYTWSDTSCATATVWVTTGDQTQLLAEQAYHPVFSASSFEWQGHTWNVRDGDGNPGDNHWSADCVHIDTNDNLHLQVKQHDEAWYSAEVLSDQSLGYGTYRWHVMTQPDTLNSNIIAGMSTAYDAFNGINIQFAQIYEETPTNMLYSIEPYYAAGHQFFSDHSFTSQWTSHEFTWNPTRITFRSWYGHNDSPPDAAALISEWSYEGTDIPIDTNEHVRMNLWMYDALPPETPQEFILSGFHYQASTGVLLQDDFNDGTASNIWDIQNAACVEENQGHLQITTADTDPSIAGYRSLSDITFEQDGRTFVFAATMASATVTTASAGDSDVWGYHALVTRQQDQTDAYAASNAATLRVGYKQSTDTLRLEFYTKTHAPDQWGNLLYAGTVSNAASLLMSDGLRCTFSLTMSNYTVNATYADNPVLMYTQFGTPTGLHQLGTDAMTGCYVLGGCNEVGGRGTVRWDDTMVTALAVVEGGSSGSEPEGPGVKEVQLGDADPANTWKFPTDTTYTKHRSMVLYSADMIDRAGTITQLMLNILSAPGLSMNNYLVRMQHTSMDQVSGAFLNDNWSTVYQDTLSIPINQQGWFAIPLSTSFEYDGTNNLLIDFCFDNSTKNSTPVPALTYSSVEYNSCFAASADKNSPLTWTGYPKGRKSKYEGNRIIDLRVAFSNSPLPLICSNLSFEGSARGFLTNTSGWMVEGSIYGGAIKSSPVLHGTNVLKLWSAPDSDHQLVYQHFDIEPNTDYILSGHLLALSADPLMGSNTRGNLCLEWYGPDGHISGSNSIPFIPDSTYDVWHSITVSSAPPVNCTSGRLVCALSYGNDQSGSLYFDKLSLIATPSAGYTNVPPSTNQMPLAHTQYLCDEFNDTERSNIWVASALWDGASMQEADGSLCVIPGSNDWQTTAYASAQSIPWTDTNAWTVFSATISTIRVDVAGSGEEIDSVIAICSLPDNPWWVTNSCSLYGHYDIDTDALRLRFLTKTDAPANNGTDRYGGIIQNASSYMTATNHICLSIALGSGLYQVTATDINNSPIPLTAVYGLARDAHNLGDKLYDAYWFVGAQNDYDNRGEVYWDRTEVFENHAPTSTLHYLQQISTDGTGIIMITGTVSDCDGDLCQAQIEVSTNEGLSWLSLDIQVTNSSCDLTLLPPSETMRLTNIETTNSSGLLTNNAIAVLWDTLGSGNGIDFSHSHWSNLLLRLQVSDTYVSGETTTTQLPLLDNLGPNQQGASLLLADGSGYTFDADITAAWSGFTDASGIHSYCCAINTDTIDTNLWSAASTAALTNLQMDMCTTVAVWAVDSFGNISSPLHEQIIVLQQIGDWDQDGISNTNELTYNTNPTDADSDGDNMLDGWELLYGYDPSSPADGLLDSDGDGYINAQESIMGTLPDDPDSRQLFDALPPLNTTAEQRLVWNSVTGRTYTVFTRTALGDAWQTLITLSGTGQMMSFTNSTTADRQYYRVSVTRP